jgi:HEPN domain-containing protein/predicted nucleotidyltransferase
MSPASSPAATSKSARKRADKRTQNKRAGVCLPAFLLEAHRMRTATLTRDEVIQRLRQAVAAMLGECEVEFVVLFGSFAYGEPHEGSDVDVLVVFPDEADKGRREKAEAILREVFGSGLEVHSCTLSEWRQALLRRNWFVAEITQKGIPIFSRRHFEDVMAEVEKLMQQSQNLYPYEWLDWAEQDWEVVHLSLDRGLVFVAAYHLQQAVEKWLEAFLLHHGWQLVRTHDLEALLREALQHEPSLQQYQGMCQRVGKFIAARYPGLVDPPKGEELRREWIPQAERLREFVRKALGVQA